MFGVVLNAVAILLGSLVGLLFKKFVNKKHEKPLLQAIGLSLIVMSVLGIITACITVQDGMLRSDGEILILVSMVLGTLVGEILDIDGRINCFSGKIEKKLNLGNISHTKTADKLFNQGISDPRQKVCFHTLRHTFASWLVQRGVDLYSVKELMGHADFKMTQRYSHLSPEGLRRAVGVLEK